MGVTEMERRKITVTVEGYPSDLDRYEAKLREVVGDYEVWVKFIDSETVS